MTGGGEHRTVDAAHRRPDAEADTRPRRIDTRGIAIFLLVAFGAAWLIALPIWLAPRHLAEPWATYVLRAMMFAPALGVLVTTRLRPASSGATPGLGLRFGGSLRRCVPYFLFAMLIIPLLGLVAPLVGALFGLVQLDLTHFSGYAAMIRQATAGVPGADAGLASLPIGVLIALQLVQIPFAAMVPNGLLAFGEELGWRGYLLPRLLPLGQWPAVLIMGAVWGLWHAPVLLLGYNYPLHHRLAVLLMVGFTMITGTLLGWLRLSTGSIWPSVVAHGAINASAGAVALFVRAGTSYDSALVGLLGVTGWIVPILLIVLLIVLRRLPVRQPR